MRIAKDLGAGNIDAVKKAAAGISAAAKKDLAKAAADQATHQKAVSKFANRMNYLEKLAATTTNEKSKMKNEKELAKLDVALEKVKRALYGATKIADGARATMEGADAAIRTANETVKNVSKTNDDLYAEAKARMKKV